MLCSMESPASLQQPFRMIRYNNFSGILQVSLLNSGADVPLTSMITDVATKELRCMELPRNFVTMGPIIRLRGDVR